MAGVSRIKQLYPPPGGAYTHICAITRMQTPCAPVRHVQGAEGVTRVIGRTEPPSLTHAHILHAHQALQSDTFKAASQGAEGVTRLIGRTEALAAAMNTSLALSVRGVCMRF